MGKRAREIRRQAARDPVRGSAGSSSVGSRSVPRLLRGRTGGAHRGHPLPIVAALAVLAVVVLGAVAIGGLSSPGSSGGPIPSGAVVFTEADHAHVASSISYDRTPPAGGSHSQAWLNCGVYGQPVPDENAVHSLEHGAVWITYRPDLSTGDVAQLRQFVESHYLGSQRYLILSPYAGIPSPVVVSAWGAQLQLARPDDPRLLQFVGQYAGGAQGGEAGGECSGGVGTPIG